MPVEGGLKLGVEISNKGIQTFAKNFQDEIKRLEKLSGKQLDLIKVDRGSIQTALADFEKIQAEAKALAKTQAELEKHPWKVSAEGAQELKSAEESASSMASSMSVVSTEATSVKSALGDVQTEAQGVVDIFEQARRVLAQFRDAVAAGSVKVDVTDNVTSHAIHLQEALTNLAVLAEGTRDKVDNVFTGTGVNSGVMLFADEAEAAQMLSDAIAVVQDELNSVNTTASAAGETLGRVFTEEELESFNEEVERLTRNIDETTESYKEFLTATEQEILTSPDLEDDPKALMVGWKTTISEDIDWIRALNADLAQLEKQANGIQDPAILQVLSELKARLAVASEMAGETQEKFNKLFPPSVDTSAVEGVSQSVEAVSQSVEQADVNVVKLGTDSENANQEMSGSISKMVEHLNELQQRLKELNQKREDVLSGKVQVSDEEWIALNNEIVEIGNSIDTTKTKINNFGHSIDEIGRGMESVSQFVSKMNSAILSGLRRVASGLKSIAVTLKNSIVKALQKVKSSFEKAFSSKNMKRNLTTLLKYTLGVRSLYFAFRKLRSAVKEGIDNLVQFQSETNLTNQRMTEFKTSLLFLKNAWGAAFAPVINVVMPILNLFIDALANVANAIARFFAALTGQSMVIQALKVSVGDYAKSLSGAGGSAKKAADEQKKLNDRLAAFDDLNVLGKDKEDEDTGSGGGGAGGGMPSVNEMFENVETPFNWFADKLRSLFEQDDFFGIGELIGKALKKGLGEIDTWLLTEGRDKILGWGKKIGEFIDGFISVDGLADTIGRTIGHAIEDGIDFVDEIITPERLQGIGEFLVEGVNAFIPIYVPKLGELLGNLFNSAVSFAYGFIKDAKWEEWGDAIAQGINNFFTQMSGDGGKGGKGVLSGWQKLGLAMKNGIIGFIDMIIEAIKGTDKGAITKAIIEFLDALDWESIKAELGALWDAIWDGLGSGTQSGWQKGGKGSGFGLDGFIDLASIKEDIEGLASAVSEFIGNIQWGDIANAIMNIATFIAGIDPDTVERIGRALLVIVGAMELIGGAVKVITFFGALKDVLHTIEMSATFMKIEGAFQGIVSNIIPILSVLGTILSIATAIVGVIVSWREAIESFQEGGGFSALFGFLGEGFAEDGIAGLGKKLGELLLGAVGTALDDFRAGVDGLINSDNPLQVLWAAFTDNDDFLTDWADDLVNSGKDWETWAGGLVSSAEGVLGVISDLSNVSMTDVLTGIWGKLSERPIDTILEGLDEWDGTKIDDALTKLGEDFTVGFNAIFGDGSSVQTSALDAWNGVFNFDSTDISAGLTTFIEDTVARFEDFKTRSADKAEEFKSVVGEKFATFRDNFGSIVDNIKEKLDGWKANFSDGITFIKDTASSFKDSFTEGFTTFKDFLIDGLQVIKEALDFSETLSGLGEVFRGAFNSVVDVINSFLSVLASGINNIGGMLNDLEFDNPITGTHYSLNIPTVNAIQIPHLAQGAVIPPNREFMAVLGDQTSGTNIEAPLDTIRQAVGDELAPYLEQLIAINTQVVQAINNKNLVIGDREIGKANARYLNQQKEIRGTML